MASFDYPNAGAPSVTVTAPMEKLPIDKVTDLGYVMIETAGGTLKSAKCGPDVTLLPLNIKKITDSVRLDLHSFLTTTVKGPTDTFTYTDEAGTVYNNCRYVPLTPLIFTRATKLLWQTDILLRVDP